MRVVHGYHEENRERAVAAETGTAAASAQEETVFSGTRSGAPGQASGGAEQGRRIRTGRRTPGKRRQCVDDDLNPFTLYYNIVVI